MVAAEAMGMRRQLPTGEWRDLLIGSIGLEASPPSERLKLLFLVHLMLMVERNY